MRRARWRGIASSCARRFSSGSARGPDAAAHFHHVARLVGDRAFLSGRPLDHWSGRARRGGFDPDRPAPGALHRSWPAGGPVPERRRAHRSERDDRRHRISPLHPAGRPNPCGVGRRRNPGVEPGPVHRSVHHVGVLRIGGLPAQARSVRFYKERLIVSPRRDAGAHSQPLWLIRTARRARLVLYWRVRPDAARRPNAKRTEKRNRHAEPCRSRRQAAA